MTVESISGALRAGGFRITSQRRAILNVIARRPEHMTPAAIYKRVRHKHGSIGLVTVYRTLEMLTDLDLLCRVHSDRGCRSYLVKRPTGHHHHMVCASCGKVVDFKACNLSALQKRLSKKTGFKIESHLLEFNGICHDCLPGIDKTSAFVGEMTTDGHRDRP
jgi:Fur family ferric uptake transcriptional regulator